MKRMSPPPFYSRQIRIRVSVLILQIWVRNVRVRKIRIRVGAQIWVRNIRLRNFRVRNIRGAEISI